MVMPKRERLSWLDDEKLSTEVLNVFPYGSLFSAQALQWDGCLKKNTVRIVCHIKYVVLNIFTALNLWKTCKISKARLVIAVSYTSINISEWHFGLTKLFASTGILFLWIVSTSSWFIKLCTGCSKYNSGECFPTLFLHIKYIQKHQALYCTVHPIRLPCVPPGWYF